MRRRLLPFASGGPRPEEGGSGFVGLVEAIRRGELDADIQFVVTNHLEGGVWNKAKRLGVIPIYMPKPYTAEHYQRLVAETDAEIVTLSGWLKMVFGLEDDTTNIHPGYMGLPLPVGAGPFSGDGMHGHFVHDKVMADIRAGLIPPYSAVTMHFVPSKPTKLGEEVVYDDPRWIIFRKLVEVDPSWSAIQLAQAVNRVEHEWQPKILNAVVNGDIRITNGQVFIDPDWVPVEIMPAL